MRFRLTTQRQDQLVILQLQGELDLASKIQVIGCVERLVKSGSPDIRADLTSLQFCDSSGLAALIPAAHACAAAGGSFSVFGATDEVATVLRISGLDRVLADQPVPGDRSSTAVRPTPR
jgi:anti-sigma B factor antagonist